VADEDFLALDGDLLRILELDELAIHNFIELVGRVDANEALEVADDIAALPDGVWLGVDRDGDELALLVVAVLDVLGDLLGGARRWRRARDDWLRRRVPCNVSFRSVGRGITPSNYLMLAN